MRTSVCYSSMDQSLSDLRQAAKKLSSIGSDVQSVCNRLSSFTGYSTGSITAIKKAVTSIKGSGSSITRLCDAGEQAMLEYYNCENTLAGSEISKDGSELKMTFPALAGLLSTAPMMVLKDPAMDYFNRVSKTFSFIKDSGDFSEWIEVLGGSEVFGDISDFLGDIGRNDFFKAVGYLGDGKKLVDAVNTGDLPALEELSEKYLKRGVKLGIKLVTGVKITGVVYSVYLDLGWHLGENAVESIREFTEEPSITSLFSGLWNTTAGTFFDAGSGLAEDALSFIGDITGKGFDSEDFKEAMDYLWNHPFKSAYATGEVLVEGVASAGDAIWNGAGWVAEKIGDCASNLFSWL